MCKIYTLFILIYPQAYTWHIGGQPVGIGSLSLPYWTHVVRLGSKGSLPDEPSQCPLVSRIFILCLFWKYCLSSIYKPMVHFESMFVNDNIVVYVQGSFVAETFPFLVPLLNIMCVCVYV